MLVLKTCPATAPPNTVITCNFSVQNQDDQHGVINLAVTNPCTQGGNEVTTLGALGTATDTCTGSVSETTPACTATDVFFPDEIHAMGNDAGIPALVVTGSASSSVLIARLHAHADADHYADEYGDGHADEYADANGHADQHRNEHADQHPDGHADPDSANQHADADQHGDSDANINPNSEADQYAKANGHSETNEDADADQHSQADEYSETGEADEDPDTVTIGPLARARLFRAGMGSPALRSSGLNFLLPARSSARTERPSKPSRRQEPSR